MSSPLVILADDVEEAVVLTDEETDPNNHPNFIESNTSAITLEELSEKCIVPTFADNTLTIANIESVLEAGKNVFGDLTPVEIRVSHQVNGRVPSALHKKASELTDEEKTVYYQRMAFVCHVAALSRSINGQTVHLCIGGVRAYNEDKLYGRQSPMKFKIFVGWQVRVCSNLMLTCDGFTGNLECMTTSDIKEHALELFNGFNPVKDDNLRTLEALVNTSISEEQFCKAVGRLRLYQALPTTTKTELGLPIGRPGSKRRSSWICGKSQLQERRWKRHYHTLATPSALQRSRKTDLYRPLAGEKSKLYRPSIRVGKGIEWREPGICVVPVIKEHRTARHNNLKCSLRKRWQFAFLLFCKQPI